MNTKNQGDTIIQPWEEEYAGAAIYSLVDANGKRYIGQAMHLQERLNSHQKALAEMLQHPEKRPLEGLKMIKAVRSGVKFRVEVLKKLEGGEATINNLRYWEGFMLEQYGGIENTYNSQIPPVPIWNHEPFNYVIVNEPSEVSKHKHRAQRIENWQKANLRRVTVKLNKTVDADIIEKIEQLENVQGYIKRLIREDINK